MFCCLSHSVKSNGIEYFVIFFLFFFPVSPFSSIFALQFVEKFNVLKINPLWKGVNLFRGNSSENIDGRTSPDGRSKAGRWGSDVIISLDNSSGNKWNPV